MNQETKKPLYKVLNEQRTQGKWEIAGKVKDCIVQIRRDEDGKAINFTMVATTPVLSSKAPYSDDERIANAQFIELAVNNLASLAEALEEVGCFDGVYRDAEERARIIRQALNRIS